MSFKSTLQAPYILVTPTSSSQDLIPLDNNAIFGLIYAVNASSTFVVGDYVYFNILGLSSMQDTTTDTIYYSIDENEIIFVEK
jgi:hypothetical protein